MNAATKEPKDHAQLVELSKRHLDGNGLLGKKTSILPDVDIDIPALQGSSLDEHFYKLGKHICEPYMGNAKKFQAKGIPPMPSRSSWIKKSGWVKYSHGKEPEAVPYPDEDEALVFDTEVMYKISDFPVLAIACSSTAWYAWVSPWFLGESENMRHLIPLGSKEKKVVIGHNISFDRKRVKEEYNVVQTNNMFLDTMSLHIAVNGMCSRQRPDFQKVKKSKKKLEVILKEGESGEDGEVESFSEEVKSGEAANPWIKISSLNNLADVAFLHCGIKHDKEQRDDFGTLTREEALAKFDELMDYCARDVDITYQVFAALLPSFFEVCPHPVTFAGLRHMSSMFLPINKSWEDYLEKSESLYQSSRDEVYQSLVQLAEKAVAFKDDETKWCDDPWLSQLDWTIKPVRLTKATKNKPAAPPKRSKLPFFPEWYRSLFPSASAPMNISVRTRVSALLLRLRWDGKPLVWSDEHGFVFGVDPSESKKYAKLNYTTADMNNEQNLQLKDSGLAYFKVPHPDGPQARCTSPLSKPYVSYFEKGILSSEYELASKALQLNAYCAYWMSNRERMHGQMTVWSDDTDMGIATEKPKDFGMILPSIIPMGTITRRAVENTWLTASNAKKNRIGSEQKAMIQTPPGYKFVGADVDSEELWIASIMGDSLFKMHGGTALGWMTLEGSKGEGTDLHSKTASILEISRNEAKVFNYGRIYGAGVKFAAQLLRTFRPDISEEKAKSTAEKLYAATKGTKTKSEKLGYPSFWRGGSESIIFNRLEELANQEIPRTPVLGCAITQALMSKNLGKSIFLTSRINWSIQSSGVDYLHLLITSMQYLIEKYNIKARLFITVHDEIRYMAQEEDVNRTALALQISNLWTRSMFSQQVGINDLPFSCAFFSLVDVDHVLRKETDVECITPSHPNAIPPGYSLDIYELAKQCRSLSLEDTTDGDGSGERRDYPEWEYTPRTPVLHHVDEGRDTIPFVKAQISTNIKSLRAIEREVQNSGKAKSDSTKKKATAAKPKKKTQKNLGVSAKDKPDTPSMPSYAEVSELFREKELDHLKPSDSPKKKPKTPQTPVYAEDYFSPNELEKIFYQV